MRKTRQTPLHQHLRFTRFPRQPRFPRRQILLPFPTAASVSSAGTESSARQPFASFAASFTRKVSTFARHRVETGNPARLTPVGPPSLPNTGASKHSKLSSFAVPAEVSKEVPCFPRDADGGAGHQSRASNGASTMRFATKCTDCPRCADKGKKIIWRIPHVPRITQEPPIPQPLKARGPDFPRQASAVPTRPLKMERFSAGG